MLITLVNSLYSHTNSALFARSLRWVMPVNSPLTGSGCIAGWKACEISRLLNWVLKGVYVWDDPHWCCASGTYTHPNFSHIYTIAFFSSSLVVNAHSLAYNWTDPLIPFWRNCNFSKESNDTIRLLGNQSWFKSVSPAMYSCMYVHMCDYGRFDRWSEKSDHWLIL